MSVLSKDTPPGVGVEIHGPFMPEHFVTLNGFKVPFITVKPHDDGTIDLFVDNRFGLYERVTPAELENWLPILANAMAVAAGYSSHGEHCNPINPFKVKMGGLGSIPPKLEVVKND